MAKKFSITEARRELLSLPDTLSPGEEAEVYRHNRPVLKIIRPASSGGNDPFSILDEALAPVLKSCSAIPAKDLARNYKKYLYAGKK